MKLPFYDKNVTCKTYHRISALRLSELYPTECQQHMINVYGYVIPSLAAIVIPVNILIIIVLMKPQVRSNTSKILSLIAISDIFNMFCPSIVYVYYFTFGNYADPMPYAFCKWTYILSSILKDMFNLISLWLTVLLAYVRYRCINSPFKVRGLHEKRNISYAVCVIVVLGLTVYTPQMFVFEFTRYQTTVANVTVETCAISKSKSIFTSDDTCMFRKILIWIGIAFHSTIPCICLLFLDISMLWKLHKAEKSRGSLRRGDSSWRSKDSGYSLRRATVCAEVETNSVNKESSVVKETDPNAVKLQANGNHEPISDEDDTECENSDDEEDLRRNNGSYKVIKKVDSSNLNVRYKHFEKGRQVQKHISPTEHDMYDIKTNLKGTSFCTPQSSLSRASQRRLKFANTKSQSVSSNQSAFDRLNQESRRTSWLILIVVTLITSHEIPLSVLYTYTLATHSGPLPLNSFGCASVFLLLWQYLTYPITFLFYCSMSSVFREEIWKLVTCKFCHKVDLPRKPVFMSPHSARKILTRSHEICEQMNKQCEEDL